MHARRHDGRGRAPDFGGAGRPPHHIEWGRSASCVPSADRCTWSRGTRRSRIEAIKAAVTEGRLGRTIIGSQIISGRRVMVQKRHAFTISVGEQPVKKR